MDGHKVFADTSALYAFVDSRDEHHEIAIRMVSELLQSGRLLVASDYVIAEAVNLANARGGFRVARRVLDLVRLSAGIQIEWIGPARSPRIAISQQQASRFFGWRVNNPCQQRQWFRNS